MIPALLFFLGALLFTPAATVGGYVIGGFTVILTVGLWIILPILFIVFAASLYFSQSDPAYRPVTLLATIAVVVNIVMLYLYNYAITVIDPATVALAGLPLIAKILLIILAISTLISLYKLWRKQ